MAMPQNDIPRDRAQSDDLKTWRSYTDAGLSVIPVATDGTKSPAWQSLPKEWNAEEGRMKPVWKPFQTRLPTDAEIVEWASKRLGIGIVGGKISRFFEALDNDEVPLWTPYIELVKMHAPALYLRLVFIETPSGGHHVPWFCDAVEGNQPLARRPRFVEVAAGTKGAKEKDGKWYVEKLDILFETRGTGGYIVAPGSPLTVHSTGKPYRFIKGSLNTIPTITADERALLLNFARAFDECQPTSKAKASAQPSGKLRPGDDYDQRGNVEQVLINHGWTVEQRVGRVVYLRKPGKNKGHQASLHAVAPNVFWCFSTSAAPFEAKKPYSPFQVYGLLEHNGDFTAAAKALAQLGFGTPKTNGKATSKKTATATDEDKPKPTDDELAARWIATQPLTVFARSSFYRYENGLWQIHPEPIAKREIKEILEAAKAEKIRPTNALLASVYALAQYTVARRDTDFDASSDYLVCRNGTLHIPTRTLGPHDPKLYITTGVNYDYDPDATAPAWERYLEWLVEQCGADVVEFLQEFAGLALTLEMKYEVAIWLVGKMGGGKSTFIEGIRAALSDRVSRLGLSDVARSRFALTSLPGKTLATCTEQPSDFIAQTDMLNAIISGETITVERKFEHPFDFNPTVKLLWAMNEKPRVADPNNGIFRRVHIINIPPIDDADKDVTLKPRIQLEGPGILNWCLDGWARLTHRGYFIKPLSVVQASYEFQLSSDLCALFMDECMERDPQPLAPTMRERSGDLYKSFKQWAIDNGHKPLSSHRAAERWQALGLERRSINGQKYYFGAELNDNAPR
jgi:putative DNA primase/helicase